MNSNKNRTLKHTNKMAKEVKNRRATEWLMTIEMTKSKVRTENCHSIGESKVEREHTHTQIHEINYECICRIETEKPLFATNVQINQSTKWEWEQRGANDAIATAATGFFLSPPFSKVQLKSIFSARHSLTQRKQLSGRKLNQEWITKNHHVQPQLVTASDC